MPADEHIEEPIRPADQSTVGALLVGGDWACAHGDAGALGHVARTLARCSAWAFPAAAAEISRLSESDFAAATIAWTRMRTGRPARTGRS
jgi:hypothetical protein